MFSFFQNDFFIKFLSSAIVLLAALPMHEYAHAAVAYRLGDPTAKNEGRLTMNPLKHLDIVGSISILLFGIGWAKPVPVQAGYFKDPKKGMALTALAGPMTNLVLGFAGFVIYKLITNNFYMLSSDILYSTAMVFYYLAYINVVLAVFNMLPVPPFDGSRILGFFLPTKYYFMIMDYERYILMGVMFLMFTGALSRPLSAVVQGVFFVFNKLTFFF